MKGPVLIIKVSEESQSFIFTKLVIQSSHCHQFSDFPVIMVGCAQETLDFGCMFRFKFPIECIDSSSEKGSFDRFEKGVPDRMEALEEVHSINFNRRELLCILRYSFI